MITQIPPTRQTNYISRLRACGIPQRDIALAWRCSPNVVTQKLNGYFRMTPDEEKRLTNILEVAEEARKGKI
jgi:hypothetical protein